MENNSTENSAAAPASESTQKIPFWAKVQDKISLQTVVKNVPFMLFLAVLAVIYITNNSKAIGLVRDIERTNKTLKELKWEYLDVQARLIYATSESQLTKESLHMGLKPLEKPAFEIKDITVIEEK